MKGKNVQKKDLFSWITQVYLCLMVSVFLLWPGTGGFEHIQSTKYTLFLLLCGGYVAVMLLCALELLLIGGIQPIPPKQLWHGSTWVQRLVVLYLTLTWISACASEHFPQTVVGVSRQEGALTITLYGVCFLLVSCHGRATKALLIAFSGAVCLFDALCIVQLFGGNPFGMYPGELTYFDAYTKYSGAYLGTVGNVDLVAGFLCLAIPVFWIALLRLKGRQRWLLLIPLALSLFVLVKMSVMAGFVGVFVGAAVCVIFVLPLPGKKRLWVGTVVGALAIGALVVLGLVDVQQELLHQIHEILNGNVDASFGSGRVRIWRDVLEKVPSRLLFGYGPDTMLLGGIEAFSRYDAALGATIVSQVDVAHNEYLNILYHQGALALAAYMGALIAAFGKFVRTAWRRETVAILGGAVLCYLLQAFFGLSLCVVTPLFWVAFGLLEKQMNGAGQI